jgi:hypothetical protein
MPNAAPRNPVEAVRSSLDRERAAWGEVGETALATGHFYRPGEAVVVSVRKRGRRYDIDDGGHAVRSAGRPAGWLDAARSVVAAEGLNVNRAGVVFVPAVEGRDLASLAWRIGETSLRVYGALLDLDE